MREREKGIWREFKDLVSNPTSGFLAVWYWQTVVPGWWYSAPPTQKAVIQTSCRNSHKQIMFIKSIAKSLKCKEWSLNIRPFVFNGYYYYNYYYTQGKARMFEERSATWDKVSWRHIIPKCIKFYPKYVHPIPTGRSPYSVQIRFLGFCLQVTWICTHLCFSNQSKLHSNTRVPKSKGGPLSVLEKNQVYTRNHTIYIKTPSFLGLAHELTLLYFGMANGSCQNTLTNSIIWELPSGTNVTPRLLHWQGKWKEMEPRGPSLTLGEG